MKYSIGFERDYNFYTSSIGVFDFCGTLNPRYEAIPDTSGHTAKECFYKIESEGKNIPCSEPELLNSILLAKASVNFQIKEWAQGRADGTLPLVEFSKRSCTLPVFEDCATLEWINGEPVYHKDIETQYNLPEWVITAVENQKVKYYK